MERETKVKERQLTTILNGISDAVIATDNKELITFMNPAAERMTGWHREEAARVNIKQIFQIDTEGNCPITAVLKNVLDTGTAGSSELPTDAEVKGSTIFTSKSGRKTHIDYSIAPSTNQKGEVVGTVITFRDTTDYKALEDRLNQTINQLQDQTQLMETIFNSISDGVMAVDTDGQYLIANTRAQEMVGPLSKEILIADRPERYGLFYPDGKTLFSGDELPIARALRGETTDNIEMLVSNDTQAEEIFININGRPLLDGQGDLKGGVIVFHDITELKATQTKLEQTISELRDKTQLMETVFDSMSDGIVVVSAAGKIMLVNPSIKQMLGTRPLDPRPSNWSETYGVFYPNKERHIPIDRLLSRYIFRGKAIRDREIFVRNEGQMDGINVMASALPLFDENREVIGCVAILRDITKSKAAEAQLEKTMQELQNQVQLTETVFNSISDGVVVTDEAGNFLLVNPSAERIVGMGATDTPPDQWSDAYGTFYPDKVTPFPNEELPLVHAMQGRVTDEVDLFMRNPENPDGCFINVTGRPLQDERNSVRGGVIVFRDVTKAKSTEARLEQTVRDLEDQTRLMEIIFNNMSDGVVVADDRGQYIMANSAMQQMVGQPLDELDLPRASEQYSVFHPTTESLFPSDQLPLARAVKGEATDNVEMRINNEQLSKEAYLSVNGRPLLDENGVSRGGVVVVRDITELKQAEIELKSIVSQLEEQGNLMESIFNSISDGVVVADADGALTIFNPSAEKIIGMGAVETDPDEWSDNYGLFFPDRVTPFPSDELPLALALKGETSDDVEMFVRNPKVPDGVFISVSGRPIRDEMGTDKGGVAVFRDVTHRVIAEEALTQAFAQGRLEIVETILHNIGNAINSVTVGINVLQENIVGNQLIHRFSALAHMVKAHQEDWVDFIENDPKGQQVLPFMIALAADFTNQNEKMVKTLERVNERVTHIIDIIRTQKSSNQPSMTRKTIDLHQTILSAVKLQHDSIGKRGIQVDVDCENAPQEIQIQESQFQQMLVNLLKNSIEAIDELIQSGGLNETPRVEIKAYIREDFLYLDVTDNGIGVAQKDSKLIFNAGYTTKDSGTGLGLHSSANFVIGSGGKIYPLSEGIGKGTTMRIMMRCSSILP